MSDLRNSVASFTGALVLLTVAIVSDAQAQKRARYADCLDNQNCPNHCKVRMEPEAACAGSGLICRAYICDTGNMMVRTCQYVSNPKKTCDITGTVQGICDECTRWGLPQINCVQIGPPQICDAPECTPVGGTGGFRIPNWSAC